MQFVVSDGPLHHNPYTKIHYFIDGHFRLNNVIYFNKKIAESYSFECGVTP